MTGLRGFGGTLLAAAGVWLFAAPIPMRAQQDNGNFTTSLYIAVLNRDPDPSGWIYWKGLLDGNNLTRDQLTNFFLSSGEYTGSGCAANNSTFLNCLYQHALNRPADQGGFNYWLGLLNSGYTQVWEVEQFIACDCFQNYWGARLNYHTAYVTVSGVAPANGSGPPGTPQQFMVHYANPYGSSDIGSGGVLFNADPNGLDANGSCQVQWDRWGDIVLSGPNGNQWGAFGQAGVLSNAYCSIDTGNSTLTGSSAGYDVGLWVTFTAQFDATFFNADHQIWAVGQNMEGLQSGWADVGVWGDQAFLTSAGSSGGPFTVYNDGVPVTFSQIITCLNADCRTASCSNANSNDSFVVAQASNLTKNNVSLTVTADPRASPGTRTIKCTNSRLPDLFEIVNVQARCNGAPSVLIATRPMTLSGAFPDTGFPYHSTLTASGSASGGTYHWMTDNPAMIQFDNPSSASVNVTVNGAGQANITVSYTTSCGTGQDSLRFVLTDDITVVGFIDSGAIGLPDGASQLVVDALNNPSNCSLTVLSWMAAGAGATSLANPSITSEVDRMYSNAFLNIRSANPLPPDILFDQASFMADPTLYRAYNRFKAYYEVTALGITGNSVKYLRQDVVLGKTPEPCSGQVVALGSDAHTSNDTRAFNQNSVRQLAEGRLGTNGQQLNAYLNHPEYIGVYNFMSVPWIWASIQFDSSGNLIPLVRGTNLQIFPTYFMYRNGSLSRNIPQATLETFIALDWTSYYVLP